MNTIATIVLSLVSELSSPDYVVYPVDDILYNAPYFDNAPHFSLGVSPSERTQVTGFEQTEKDKIETLRILIEDDFASRGVSVKVFFFNKKFIVKEIR